MIWKEMIVTWSKYNPKHFLDRLKKTTTTSLKIAGVVAEIPTDHLPNMTLGYYRYTVVSGGVLTSIQILYSNLSLYLFHFLLRNVSKLSSLNPVEFIGTIYIENISEVTYVKWWIVEFLSNLKSIVFYDVITPHRIIEDINLRSNRCEGLRSNIPNFMNKCFPRSKVLVRYQIK
jgi:hypothetical protein